MEGKGRKSEALTAAGVEKLKPKAKDYELSDGGNGLRLRVTANGRKAWRWHYRDTPSSPQKVVTLGYYTREGTPDHMSLKAARNRLDELQTARREHRLSEVLGGGEDAPGTVKELAEKFYRLRILPHRVRPEVVRDVLDRDILRLIGTRKLSAFTTPACRLVVEDVVGRGAKTYAGRVLQVLKQLGRFGQANSYIPGNPAAPLESSALGVEDNSDDRWLTSEEIVLWWRALDLSEMTPTTRLGLRLLLLTGVRTGELLKAKWSDVNFDENKAKWEEGQTGPRPTWTIPVENQKLTKKKQKKARPFVVALSPQAVALLRELKNFAADSEWVMYSPASLDDDGDEAEKEPHLSDKALALAMRRLWKERKSRKGPRKSDRTLPALLTIPQASPHDLRRTMRTHYEETLGIEPHVAERALNHSLGRIAATYNRGDYFPAREKAANAWGLHVEQIVAGKPATVTSIRSAS